MYKRQDLSSASAATASGSSTGGWGASGALSPGALVSGALASGRETSGWEASGLPWLEEVLPPGWEAVSYTHLDVYKRQPQVTGVYHCYSGSLEDAKVLVKLGWKMCIRDRSGTLRMM